MPGIDGTDDNRIRETEQVEKIEPEKCENQQDFDKALEKKAGQLDSALDNSKGANKMADIMAEKYSPEELLEKRKQYDDSGAKFKDACFGEHSDWSDEKRTEEIGKAKGEWESNHIGAHRIDMALERLGYDPSANSEGTSETKPNDGEGTSETKPNDGDGTSETKPNEDEGTSGKAADQPGMKKTLEDLGGHKVEKQEPLQVKPDDGEGTSGKAAEQPGLKESLGKIGDKVEKPQLSAEELKALKDGGGTQHELEQKAEGTHSPVDETSQQSSYPEATGTDDSNDKISRQAILQEIQNRRGR